MQRRLHRAESLDHLLPGAQDDLSTPSDSRRASEDEAETKERDSRQGSFAAPLETRKADRRFSGWKRWTLILAILVGGLLAIVGAGGLWVYKSAPPDGQSPPWYPTPRGGSIPDWQDAYTKAAAMVRKLSLVEKVNITTQVPKSTGGGERDGVWVFAWATQDDLGPVPSVGFPSLCLQDGPLGIRFADHITAFPAGITVGATWDRDLMYKRGQAMGLEARRKGINVLLSPSMGALGRHPAGGRNWEGFGTDPVLQAAGAAQTIKGIQDEGVIATAKHYIGNEQEHFRQSFEWGLPNAMSSNIDDRTLHELYLWPFAESIRAQARQIPTLECLKLSDSSYACGNSRLLNGILKDELGFQGFVQSDWLATRSGVASALAGLDMTMPGDGLRWAGGKSLWGPHLTKAVLNTSIPLTRLDDMVTRIVATWYKLRQDDSDRWPPRPPEGDGGPNFSSFTDDEYGLLYPGSGDNASAVVNRFIDVQGEGKESHGLLVRQIAAEGTVLVKNEEGVLPLEAESWLGKGGGTGDKIRVAVIGEDAIASKDPNSCPDRGCNEGTLASGWGSGAVNYPYLIAPLDALKAAINPDKVNLTAFPSNILPHKQLPNLLKDQDYCIVFANADGGEGYIAYQGIRGDRNDLFLQKNGDRLIKSVASDCGGGQGKVVVVIHAVGPVIVEKWADMEEVKAIIFANLPGQESGNALVDVLFGRVNPGAKLPYTVGKSLDDYGPGAQVLYYANGVIPQQNFTEGLYIDYRHFDKFGIEPRYEFGYGLSYTSFELSGISAVLLKPKSALPSVRPSGIRPPIYTTDIPSARDATFPTAFRRLRKYVYPYIEPKDADKIRQGRYPYPEGYDRKQMLSSAGGGEGGNPSLWDVYAEVNVTLTNTGSRVGKEVVQLYLSFPPNVPTDAAAMAANDNKALDYPVKTLRGFEKSELNPGDSKVLTFQITRKDLSFWSVTEQNWVMPTQGRFKIHVGNSSRNLVLHTEL